MKKQMKRCAALLVVALLLAVTAAYAEGPDMSFGAPQWSDSFEGESETGYRWCILDVTVENRTTNSYTFEGDLKSTVAWQDKYSAEGVAVFERDGVEPLMSVQGRVGFKIPNMLADKQDELTVTLEMGGASQIWSTENQYQKALALLESGDATGAYDILQTMHGYKDVDELFKTNDDLSAMVMAAYSKVGSVVTYGHYEQDGNTSNGKEAIEWIVLDYDADKGEALLISKYGLEAKQYHHERPYPTWEKSDVRKWLNADFLNAAFTSEEQKGIQTVKISTLSYEGNSGGNDTQDKIWLLSRDEAEEYFRSDEARQTTPTKYAVSTGAYHSSDYEIDGTGCCWWWLRSPGYYSLSASCVFSGGSLNDLYVYYTGDVVRPAFVLNLASAVIS